MTNKFDEINTELKSTEKLLVDAYIRDSDSHELEYDQKSHSELIKAHVKDFSSKIEQGAYLVIEEAKVYLYSLLTMSNTTRDETSVLNSFLDTLKSFKNFVIKCQVMDKSNTEFVSLISRVDILQKCIAEF